MNRINPVRAYTNLRNNPQPTSNPTPQTPAFKGALGDKVVKEITDSFWHSGQKTVTAASILAMAAGLIGLSKDKLSDILDSMISKIADLQHKNDSLNDQMYQLKQETTQKVEVARLEFANNERRLRDFFSATLQEKNIEINKKDAKIAELQKYADMAKVKSIYELDIISPEQFIELLKEAKEAQPKAEESLLNYLFNGNGQEEFLAQMERSNKILKARGAGITQIPEMQEAYEGSKLYIGYEPVWVAQHMMEKVLKNNEKGSQVNYRPIRDQIQKNADALINPMMTETHHYPDTNKEILNKVSKFYNDLASKKAILMKDKNLRFEQRNVNSKNRPYYSFVNNKNEKFDIYLSDLASGSLGLGRWTRSDGSVDSWAKNGYWE